MIDQTTLFEIHQKKALGYSNRKIGQLLGIDRETVKKYLVHPTIQKSSGKVRASRLDGYKQTVDDFLNEDLSISATVVFRKITALGYSGKISILRDYLRKQRGKSKTRKSFIRFESLPGQQMQTDWGHFGTIQYGDHARKLSMLAVVESYSRMLYVEFTHSQASEVLHQCLYNAFDYFGGTPQELVVDNMLTAVSQRQGKIIQYHDGFLSFLTNFKITPKACNVRSPHEKGKIERAISYIRKSFWPLTHFETLKQANEAALTWLNETANQRVHQTTSQAPDKRLQPGQLRVLPDINYQSMQIATCKVTKDFCVRFDLNSYSVPPHYTGSKVTLKADQSLIAIFSNDKKIATHHRCWDKNKRIELPSHVEQVKQVRAKMYEDQTIAAFAAKSAVFRRYLSALSKTNQPIKKNVERLLKLIDLYDCESVAAGVTLALKHNVFAYDYIQNILYQSMTPKKYEPPVQIRDTELKNMRLSEVSLQSYDSVILKQRKNQ